MTVPRFHTERDPRYRSIGSKIAKASAALGRPPMPWQRRAVDVIGEVDDNGKLRYHTVIITVPRQSGKTAISLGTSFHRALWLPGSKTWFTAQTGQAARERFLDDLGRPAAMRFPSLVKLNRGAGDTRLTIPATGSQIRPHPPTEEYLHGEQSDLNLIDEPWVLTEDEASALMQAIEPTQATRPNAQTIMLSTAGTAASTWWHRQVDEAREGKPGVAIIDYGIPDGVDPGDLEAVIAAHPAVGHTINRSAIEKAYQTLTPAEFARGYGNVPTVGAAELFSDDELAAVTDDAPITDDARVAVAVAVGRDLEESAIVAAGMDGDTPVIEVIDARPGVGWLADEAAAVATSQGLPIWLDRIGPASDIADALESRGIEVIAPRSRDVSNAVGGFVARMRRGSIRLRSDAGLAAELRGAKTRDMGDAGIMWSRKKSVVPISRLEAATLAAYAVGKDDEAPQPMIWIPKNEQ